MKTGYLAPEGLEESLRRELKGSPFFQAERLFVMDGPPIKAHWAQNVWLDARLISFQSISEAAKKLRDLQGLWSHYPTHCVRRGELIASQLPFFGPKPLQFPAAAPTAPIGAWTLLDEHTLLAAPRTSTPFVHGEVHFQETKVPPSRAYLKLWELFTRMGHRPKAGEKCLEVGASPGSWTWVLQQLGAEVVAVDRAPLEGEIGSLPGVAFLKRDAFTLGPKDFPEVDWVFSDLVCYPEKLLEWIQPWVASRANLVCTLKFQGKEGEEIIREFEKIEGGRLIHLFHNKHELTWVRETVYENCKQLRF